jgi:vitamin B12 transporter
MCGYLYRGGVAAAISIIFPAIIASANGLVAISEPSELVVTGTRTSIPASDTLASTTVLTEHDIETRQVLSLQDLLQGESGVQLSNNGGLGKASSLFLRGTNSDHVLVLVDGVRMGSSTLGTAAFQYLPIDSLGRIEIVRGPLSSLYGSEAMGGVVQIFTRRPIRDGISFDADATAGSHGTSSIGAHLSAVSGSLSFGLSASNLSSEGYPNCTGAPYVSPSSPGGGCFVYDTENDGYHNVSGSASLRYQFSDLADVEGTVLRSQGGTRYAGSFTNHEDFAEQAASIAVHWTPVTALKLTLQIGQSHDNERDTLNFVDAGSLFDTTRNSASIQGDWQVSVGQLVTIGADRLQDRIASDTVFPVTSRSVTGVFGEYQARVGSQQIALTARNDDNSQFGGKTTGSAAWGYWLSESLKVVASFGTAFHAPSFDNLYFPFFGNPQLSPETSRSADVGIEQHSPTTTWAVHGFETRIHDLISYDAVQFTPENTDEARIRGIELQGGAKHGPWVAEATAGWLDARNETAGSPDHGNLLPRRAHGTGRLAIAREWARLRIGGTLNIASRRFDDLANAAPLGGYTTADLVVDWTPLREWRLQAKIANATDRRYETALYYPQDRRNFLLTLRYRPAGL